jgi:hypothetical protein
MRPSPTRTTLPFRSVKESMKTSLFVMQQKDHSGKRGVGHVSGWLFGVIRRRQMRLVRQGQRTSKTPKGRDINVFDDCKHGLATIN